MESGGSYQKPTNEHKCSAINSSFNSEYVNNLNEKVFINYIMTGFLFLQVEMGWEYWGS